MPDRGLLERDAIVAEPLARGGPEGWEMTGVRMAQVTFEMAREPAVAAMPGDVSRPVPCYGRVFLLEAATSPAGPFRLAALLVGGRYRMMPRNVLVEGIVDGPLKGIASAFGSPFRAGTVAINRDGARLTATVEADEGRLCEVEIPALAAVDPTMLRWDAWLGFARDGDALQLVEYGPQPRASEAFLSKGGRVAMSGSLPRGHRWRQLRNLNTISACYLEGDGALSLPEVQQAIL
ncbi:MAG TPA: hypothetical protein VFY90_11420 [Tepidiformaceae bacterium]|nr:hypothetical protein [Tepidiformaceae bacterium]